MSYVIAGRAIKSEYLALGILFGIAGISTLGLSGGKKKEPVTIDNTTPVGLAKEQGKAGSSEEEAFIRNFIAEAEKGEKAEKH